MVRPRSKPELWCLAPAVVAGAGMFLLSCASVRPQAAAEEAAERPAEARQILAAGKPQPAGQVVPLDGPEPGEARERHGLPLSFFQTADFVGSGRCSVCHEWLADRADHDMSISNHWRSTMMANAARDPLWQAKVSSEVARNPSLQAVIEAKCAICHTPMAYTQATADGQAKALFGSSGFLGPDAPLHEAAMDGVSCSLCHQIQDHNLGTKGGFSGKFTVDTAARAPERPVFGPYHETIPGPMQTSVGFTPLYGAHINDSALCAACHTLFSPYVDGAGQVAGEFPEQTPYLEWLHSEFGVRASQRYDIGENPGSGMICQECHMPHSQGGKVKIARWAPPEVKEKDHFSQHHFVGGNVFMLNVLQDNADCLQLTASTAKLADTRARTMSQLQTASGVLTLEDARRDGAELVMTLEVANQAGHKFPTGFPSRNLWLHVTVIDQQGGVVFESGRPLADGRIAGNDADEQGLAFEPHYQVISSPDQVQIFEAVMGNTDGQVTHTLLRAARYLKDNRLLPRGFDKTTAGADIAVYGAAAADPDFGGGSDRIVYRVAVGNHSGPFTVRAALLYQAVSHHFMADLRQDSQLAPVARMGDFYDRADKRPVAVAALQAQLP